jgi:hypothetical protein
MDPPFHFTVDDESLNLILIRNRLLKGYSVAPRGLRDGLRDLN